MSVRGVFDQRYRGFRVIEIGGVGVLLALILLVYLAKTVAGSESAQIDHVQQQIADEQAKVALLRAEVASLEQPERLETLSNRYLGLQPVDAKHEIDVQALANVAGAPTPQQPAPGAPPQATTQSTTPQSATPQSTTPALTPSVAAGSDAAKPAKAVVATQPNAVKPVKVAAATPKPAKPAAAVHSDEPEPPPVESRPSELKAPALDPIGALTPTPADGAQ